MCTKQEINEINCLEFWQTNPVYFPIPMKIGNIYHEFPSIEYSHTEAM